MSGYLKMNKRKSGKMYISDLRILACGFFLEQYPRWDILWEGLSRLSFQQLIDLRDKRVFNDEYLENLRNEGCKSTFHRITRKIRSFYYLFRYAISISQMARQKKVDIIFVFPGNVFLVVCLGILRVLHGANVYFDLYTSEYSAAKAHSQGRFMVVQGYILEFLACRFADELICLTPEYANYYQNLYKVTDNKFTAVPDGVQDIWFDEPASISQEAYRSKRVLYWGNFLVQHGFDMVLDTAEDLRDENIELVFCGRGDKEAWVKEEVHRRNLSNIVFRGFIPTTKELIHIIDSADITLGHLKDMHDTGLSASNKMKQGMARGKSVITVWTKQKEELYQTKNNPFPPLIQIVPGAKSLAKAIMEIVNDPQKAERIGKAARSTVKRLHSVEAITSALKKSLEKALDECRRAERSYSDELAK